MFIDHLLMLFTGPKDPQQLTFYNQQSQADSKRPQLEEFTVEMSRDLAHRLSSPPPAPSPSPSRHENGEKRAELKQIHSERYHVDSLRRETEELLDIQRAHLPPPHKSLTEAMEAERAVMECYQVNAGRPLNCLEQVQKMQILAREVTLGNKK